MYSVQVLFYNSSQPNLLNIKYTLQTKFYKKKCIFPFYF